MIRTNIDPRPDYQQKLESIGLYYHSTQNEDGSSNPYWNESAFYQFTLEQINELEEATQKIHEMCLEAVDNIVRSDLFHRFNFPEIYKELIYNSWKKKDVSLYGRLDLRYDGYSPPKLLEYNADTPTSLLEASVAQWYWLEDIFSNCDQFNSIHDKLVKKWKNLNLKNPVYFSCVRSQEDFSTIEYLRETAKQAFLQTEQLFVEEIGWNGEYFTSLKEEKIDTIFKLYPYEWMMKEKFGPYLLKTNMQLIEPAWKALLVDKIILEILWEMYPNNKYLLPTFSQDSKLSKDFVKKPRLGREGSNVEIVKDGKIKASTNGEYGEEGYVFQELCELPCFNGNYALIGSWIIGDEPAGIGIRESNSLITENTCRFVPHCFLD